MGNLKKEANKPGPQGWAGMYWEEEESVSALERQEYMGPWSKIPK